MSDLGSTPPDKGPVLPSGDEKPLTALQAAGALAAVALLGLLAALVGVLFHLGDPLLAALGRPGGRASLPSPPPSPSEFSPSWRCAPCGRRCDGSGRRWAPRAPAERPDDCGRGP
jgi:hypothetical protein